jgi:hypothetical protein
VGNARGDGGGILNDGTLTVSGSTISGNRAGNEGGGVYSANSLSGPTTTITNSTISGNTATSRGGGVFNGDGLTVIEDSTITKNTAPSGSGSGVASFGGERNRTEVLSTIISDNTNTDVDFTTSGANTFVSKGYNLIGDGNATGAFNQSSDQTNVNAPKLGALAGNGGPTETHALLAGSPAIDKGNSDLASDQRGKKRPFDDPGIAPATDGDNSDIGSFEAQSVLDSGPGAAGDAYSIDEDKALTVAAPGVLSNGPASGKTLTAVLVGGPSHAASFELNSNGSFSYTPNKDYNGPDSFTYEATNGTEDSNPATVSLEVNPLDDAPTISVVAGSASQSACLSNTSGRITLKLSDVDSNLGDLKPSVASSSDTRLVPKSNVAFGGTDGTRTATISTVAGRTGTSTVRITASDG